LTPLLEDTVPEEVLHDFRQLTSNLQLAYAKASEEESGAGPGEDGEREPGGED